MTSRPKIRLARQLAGRAALLAALWTAKLGSAICARALAAAEHSASLLESR
jgi:hypothetical protein